MWTRLARIVIKQRPFGLRRMSSDTIRPGLDRILPLLERLGSPQSKLPVIHIAGTNSKGTTSSILDSVLLSLGISTARFNSPHLIEQRDSCLINGEVVSQHIWNTAGEKVKEANTFTSSDHSLQAIEATSFEQLFATFLISTEVNSVRPQVLIVECGMGGSQDATNVFSTDNVLASVITPIGSDHKSFLGSTLAEITEQKMGILKQNGLCIVADQRDPQGYSKVKEESTRNAHLTSWSADDENEDIIGQEASQVYSTIRRIAETQKARLVKCETAYDVLDSATTHTVSSHTRPWEKTTQWSVILPPILHSLVTTSSQESDPKTGVSLSDSASPQPQPQPQDQSLASTLYTNSPYKSLPGQNPLTTPRLPHLPPTYPILSSLSTALSTLYAIASDETQSGDQWEELRLQLAFGLQSHGLISRSQQNGVLSDSIEDAIQHGVRSWRGRGSWIDLPLPSERDTSLHTIVDGAHNPPALRALFTHLSSLIAHHTRPITMTILVSLSSSKEKDGDLDEILDLLIRNVYSQPSMQTLSLQDNEIQVRIGFLPFSKPEGMTWVSPLDPHVLKDRVTTKRNSLKEVQSFDTLPQAIEWAAKTQEEEGVLDGRPTDEGGSSLCVVTGSLYLVADVYRLLEAH
ncbi:unnamed protein product [Sympodiomycopsis kandeliae]